MEAKPSLKTQFLLFTGKKPEMDGKSFNKCMKDSKLMGKDVNFRKETHSN